jgi:RNA polymerase II subunit A C-terminal domain phosphatase
MLVKLPESLYYPITITRCLVLPGEEVKRLQTVLHYEYKTEVKEDTDTGEEVSVTKTFPAQFESPVEGKLTRWYIRVGSVIPSSK